MKHFFNSMTKTLSVLLSVGLCVACSDKWDEHYSIDPSVPQQTMLELIKGNPEASNFLKVLENTTVMNGDKLGEITYKELLDGDQFFTLWLPLNSSLSADEWEIYMKAGKTKAENTETVRKFLNNHLSRFKYSADGTLKTVIMMSNKRYLMSDDYIDEAEISDVNEPCTNGIIHSISSKLPYSKNIYEYLIDDDSPYKDNLGAFIKKYTKLEINTEKSVSAGYYNENDELVYADSVMDEKNVIWDMFGYINCEDSTYNMIIPVSFEWESDSDECFRNNAYHKAMRNFHFGYSAQADSDSIQTYWSHNALLTDAVFNMNPKTQPYLNGATGGRMVSTTFDLVNDRTKRRQYHIYPNPFGESSPFEFIDTVDCSNGTIYICENWPFDPQYTYAAPMVVEAEDEAKLFNWTTKATKSIYTLMSFEAGGKVYKLSDDKALRMNYTNTWNVQYRVPNSLSGPTNFYAVVAPDNISRDKQSKAAVKNQFTFTVTYTKADGSIGQYQLKNGSVAVKFENDVNKLDTVYVGTVDLPVCYYNMSSSGLQLQFSSSVTSTMRNYSKEVFLDCLIVEPAPLVETEE